MFISIFNGISELCKVVIRVIQWLWQFIISFTLMILFDFLKLAWNSKGLRNATANEVNLSNVIVKMRFERISLWNQIARRNWIPKKKKKKKWFRATAGLCIRHVWLSLFYLRAMNRKCTVVIHIRNILSSTSPSWINLLNFVLPVFIVTRACCSQNFNFGTSYAQFQFWELLEFNIDVWKYETTMI